MKLRFAVSFASMIAVCAGMANAQSSSDVWGDGAAYGGAVLLGAKDNVSVPQFDTSPIAGDTLNRPKMPITPGGKTGECAARITIPAQYRTDQRQVIVQDAHKTLTFSEPNLQSDKVRVKVRDEYTRYQVRQPRWEVETEDVVTRPEYERLTVRPAQWKYIDETVDISQPRLVWKRGKIASSEITRTDPVTGTIFTLIEEPGEKRTFRKRVMVQPEQVVATRIPAKSLTVTRRVLTDPGGVDSVTVPAEFRTYDVQRLIQPATAREMPVPAKRKLISSKVMVSPERWDWVPVLCGDKVDAVTIRDIQTRLASANFYEGTKDGVFGSQTRRALEAFQEAQGYYHGGELSLVTLEKLGILLPN